MKKLTIIILISFISLSIISCSSEKSEYTSTATSTATSSDNTTTDTTAPTIAEVTAVSTPASDTTPNYTFSSSEAGTITYGGSCSSSTSSATTDNNTVTFTTLSNGTFSDCTIKVTDSSGNISSALSITSFTIDTAAPTSTSISINS